MLYKFLRDEHGEVLVFVAIGILACLLFAAMATDIGYVLTAKNQLQSAVDAAALAGATGLMSSQAEARSDAVHFAALNNCIGTPVIVNSADVTFPNSTQIRVHADRILNTFFLRLINLNTLTAGAEAVVQMDYIKGTTGMAPWCVPNGNWQNGDHVVLKAGGKGELGASPCWRYPVDYPPVNRGTPITGASEYVKNLEYGSDCYIEVGDELQIEPGNMVGPASQGVNTIVDRDPNAVWENGGVENSNAVGFTSPRIVIIPMYDPSQPPLNGRGNMTVSSLGAFFVLGMSGGDVVGIFMNIITDGTRGSSYSLVHQARIVS